MTDYKKLCQDLFGTTDVAELTELSKQIGKNPKNAGRKKIFTDSDLVQMNKLLEQGASMQQIAKQYGTTRQTVDRYLSRAPQEGYTMRIDYMHRRRICSIIDVDFLERRIKVQNRVADPLRRAFGTKETPDWPDFEYLLQDRCVPASRGHIKELLAGLGVTGYDPLQILEKTQGRTADDEMWMKFHYYPRKAGAMRENS